MELALPYTSTLRARNVLPVVVAVAVKQLLEYTDLAHQVLDLQPNVRGRGEGGHQD